MCRGLRAPLNGPVLLACMIAGCLTGCASSSSATAPSPRGLSIRVNDGQMSLKTGDRAAVQIFVADSNGIARMTDATLSTDDESVARFEGANTLIALSPGTVVIRATSQEYSSSLSLTIVQNFEGRWAGFYKVEQCTRISGGGSSYCRFVIGGAYYMRLELSQRGQEFSGQISMGDNLGSVILRTGTVTGEVSSTGLAILRGRTTSITPEQPGTSVLSGWTSEVTSEGHLTGRFTEDLKFTNAFGMQTGREEDSLQDLRRE
jgi:hypothetical protein